MKQAAGSLSGGERKMLVIGARPNGGPKKVGMLLQSHCLASSIPRTCLRRLTACDDRQPWKIPQLWPVSLKSSKIP